MAINERTRLPNKHSLYLATSGYGKSQTLKRQGGLPPTGARVALWDNNKDHPAHRFSKLGEFVRALDRAHKSGKGFRIAYTGEASPDAFEVWSYKVWSILNGERITYGLIEEYSDCCRGPGALSPKIDTYHRKMWTQSRKYGGILHATSQRPQLISKDALGNAGMIWGSFMDMKAARRVAEEMDMSAHELRSCQIGEFYHRQIGKPAEKMRVFTPI